MRVSPRRHTLLHPSRNRLHPALSRRRLSLRSQQQGLLCTTRRHHLSLKSPSTLMTERSRAVGRPGHRYPTWSSFWPGTMSPSFCRLVVQTCQLRMRSKQVSRHQATHETPFLEHLRAHRNDNETPWLTAFICVTAPATLPRSEADRQACFELLEDDHVMMATNPENQSSSAAVDEAVRAHYTQTRSVMQGMFRLINQQSLQCTQVFVERAWHAADGATITGVEKYRPAEDASATEREAWKALRAGSPRNGISVLDLVNQRIGEGPIIGTSWLDQPSEQIRTATDVTGHAPVQGGLEVPGTADDFGASMTERLQRLHFRRARSPSQSRSRSRERKERP